MKTPFAIETESSLPEQKDKPVLSKLDMEIECPRCTWHTGCGFYLLGIPGATSVENHHNKAGVKCGWVTEVELIRPSTET